MNSMNKKMISSLIVSLFLLSIVAIAMPVNAKDSTIHVYEGQSIQAAIDTAPVNGKVIVHSGTYSDEQIVIDKALTLTGNGAVLEYSQQPTTTGLMFSIRVAADGVRISGFTIIVTNPAYTSAIDASYYSGTVIDNNIIEAQRWGVSGYGTSNVEIRNNQITATTPVYFTNPQNIVVKNNLLEAKTFVPNAFGFMPIGIRLAGSFDNGEVKNNVITSDCFGIFIGNLQSNGATVNWDSGTGITNTVVKNNVVLSSICALYVQKAPGIVIKNNDLTAEKFADATLGPKMWRYGVEIAVPNCAINLAGTFSGGSVKNNEISSIFRGINVEGPQNIDIISNTLNYIGPNMVATAGISLAYQAANAENPYFASNNELVKGNTINNYGCGVWIQKDGTNNIVTENIIAAGDIIASDLGVLIMQNARFNTITYNTISGVAADFAVRNFSGNTDNTIENNTVL